MRYNAAGQVRVVGARAESLSCAQITVRQLLAHQAGLFAFDEPVDKSVVADLDRLGQVMARHKPAWPPGTRQASHGLMLGFSEGVMRRVDPRQRSLGQFFQDEIATPDPRRHVEALRPIKGLYPLNQ